jgi:hypothetical protein
MLRPMPLLNDVVFGNIYKGWTYGVRVKSHDTIVKAHTTLYFFAFLFIIIFCYIQSLLKTFHYSI